MCRDVRILEIESFMRYFFGIVGHPRISLFYDFSYSSQYFDIPILYYGFQNSGKISLIRGYRYNWLNHIKTFMYLLC